MLKIDENGYTFDFSRTLTLTKEDVDDIMSTALEGDITSEWAYKVEPTSGHYLGKYASEQISRGGALRFYVYDDSKKYILDLDKLIEGVQRALSRGYGADWFNESGTKFDPSIRFDSVQADIVMQFALFGEIVYS